MRATTSLPSAATPQCTLCWSTRLLDALYLPLGDPVNADVVDQRNSEERRAEHDDTHAALPHFRDGGALVLRLHRCRARDGEHATANEGRAADPGPPVVLRRVIVMLAGRRALDRLDLPHVAEAGGLDRDADAVLGDNSLGRPVQACALVATDGRARHDRRPNAHRRASPETGCEKTERTRACGPTQLRHSFPLPDAQHAHGRSSHQPRRLGTVGR